MIVLFCNWIIICFIFFSIGNAVTNYSNHYFKTDTQYGFFDTFFIGLCITGTFLNIWSIFFPTNFLSFISLLFLSLTYWGFNFNRLKSTTKSLISNPFIHYKYLIPFAFILIFVVLYALLPPIFYDTYLYHIPSIKWNEQFRVVPGLANFHSRFGYNSSILLLGTAFSFESIFKQLIFSINSLSVFIFLIWLMKNMITKRAVFAIMALIVYYHFFDFYSLSISSLSTDILPNLLFAYLILRIVFNNFEVKDLSLVFWIIPLFCVTLKISTCSIILLCFLALTSILKNKSYKYLFFLILISLVVLIPWITRNLILTGYLAYPTQVLDIFNFDWEVPIQNVINDQKWIYSWGRIPGMSHNEVLSMPLNEWFSKWWEVKSPFMKQLFNISYFSPVIFLVLINSTKYNKFRVFLCWIIFLAGFLMWFFTAPDYRFAYGIIILSIVFPILLIDDILKYIQDKLIKYIHLKYFNYLNTGVKVIVFIYLFIYGVNFIKIGAGEIKKYVPEKSFTSLIYIPYSFENVKNKQNVTFNEHQINGITTYTPSEGNDQCFDKFPCSPYYFKNIELRGSTLKNGFRVKKPKEL